MSRCILLAILLAPGCVPRAVTDRIAALEARVARLEAAADPPGSDEAAAADLARRAEEALAAGDVAGASRLLDRLVATHPDTAAARSARRMQDELSLVGREVADLSGAVLWFQGEAPDLSTGRHLVVFFETWCPHCRREVPRIPEVVAGREVDVLLVTRVSRSATDDGVRGFLAEHGLPYPTVKDDGAISRRFAVRGIPAAAVVVDGRVAWRGHPARLVGGLRDAVLPPR